MTTIVGADPDIHPDDKDLLLLTQRAARWQARVGRPRVGDWIRRMDGTLERFAYDWGDGLQTSVDGTYYLTVGGWASMSGSLFSAIPNARIVETPETKEGRFWFFHNDHSFAHSAIYVELPCRVYEERRVETT